MGVWAEGDEERRTPEGEASSWGMLQHNSPGSETCVMLKHAYA